MKTRSSIIVALLFTVLYCSASTNEKQLVLASGTETSNNIEEGKPFSIEHDSIVLNNGEKWKVVETMLIYIRNMEKAVNKFESTKSEDYVVLAQTIDNNIRDLTSNCTMKGQAHDELHKWLVPFIGLSEEFDVATEKDDQEKIYKAFQDAFTEFNTYFE